MLNQINHNTKWQYAIVVLALLPLLFINQNGWHDWGGDFAQYIHLAKNIWEGTSVSENHYVFNPDYPLAPPTYPVGFPLLLVPIYAIFGNSILAFKIYISCFWIASLLVFFEILRNKVHFLNAFIILLFIGYNPWILDFKSIILSDIPFVFFFLLAVWLYDKVRIEKPAIKSILLGLTIGFSIAIKNIGIALILMIAIDQIIIGLQKKFTTDWLKKNAVIGISVIVIYGIIQFIFPPEKNTFSFTSNLFQISNTLETVKISGDYYLTQYDLFFSDYLYYDKNILSKILARLVLLLTIPIVVLQPKKYSHYLVLMIIFTVMVFLYPNHSQGFRYLLPILLIVFVLFLLTIQKLGARISFGIAILFLGFQIWTFSFGDVLSEKKISGPLGESEQQFFSFIDHQTSENAVFVFEKPRVLGLYGHRNSYAIYQHNGKEFVEEQLNKIHWDYIATHPEVYNHSLDLVIRDLIEQDKVECVYYQEGGFALFRRR